MGTTQSPPSSLFTPADEKPVSVKYYNLQGILVGEDGYFPLQSGIYIVKYVCPSGKTVVEKRFLE
jgi:hypothetical protein